MKAAAVALCLVLAACATPQQRAARAQAAIETTRANCTAYGFRPGTNEHAECVSRQMERADERQRTLAAQRPLEFRLLPIQPVCTSTPDGFGGFRTTCQ